MSTALRSNDPILVFFRHALVGGGAYVLFFIAIAVGVAIDLQAFWISLWSGFSFAAVSVMSFFLHRIFTYRSERRDWNAVRNYFIVIAMGAIAAAIVGYVAKSVTSGFQIVLCQVVFAGCWAIVSNILMKLFVFKAVD